MRFTSTKDETKILVEHCRRGDSKAQYKLYQKYSDAMYNTSLRIVKHKEEAEDVIQEAFLDVFNKIDTFRGESTFGAWLKVIVINKSISKLQSVKLQFEELKTDFVKEEDTTEDLEDHEGAIHRIKNLMNELPDGYRLVLSLYLFEGYDHKEIAQILGITEVTSRTQYLRAKKKLLELYYSRI